MNIPQILREPSIQIVPRKQDTNNQSSMIEDESPLAGEGNGIAASAVYSPSEARVECFGIELAIRNRDVQMFKYLWNDFTDRWDEKHFAFVLSKML
jgi:hypothetical protein